MARVLALTALLLLVAFPARAQTPDVSGAVWALLALGDGPIAAGSSANGVYLSTDDGDTFSFVGPEGAHVWDLALADDVLFAAAEGCLFAAFDGMTFEPVPIIEGLDVHVYDVTYAEETDCVYVATWGQGVYYAFTDDLTDWTEYNAGLPSEATLSVEASETTDTAVAGVYGFGVWRRPFGASEWEQASDLGGADAFELTSTCGDFWAGTRGGGTFASTDDGVTWQPAGLDGLDIYDLVPASDCTVLAATSDGVWLADGPGDEWDPVAFQGQPILSVAYTGDGVCGGTTYGEVLCSEMDNGGQTTADEGAASAPQRLALDAPFPNPVSRTDAVELAFELRAAGPAEVVVYDVRGAEVARPVGGTFAAGRQALMWRPGLAPGLYVVRLATPEGAVTQKLVVQ